MPEQFRPEPSSSSAESMPSFLFEDNFEETSLWERLSTYSDGEADEYEQEDIERLLQSDPILARELNFLNTTHHLLSNIEEVAPPVSLRQSILVATSQRPTLRRRVEQLLTTLRQQPTLAVWGRYAVPVGAVALIAGVSYGVFSSQSTPPNSPPEVAVVQKESPEENPVVLPTPVPSKPLMSTPPQEVATVNAGKGSVAPSAVNVPTPRPRTNPDSIVFRPRAVVADRGAVERHNRPEVQNPLPHKPLGVQESHGATLDNGNATEVATADFTPKPMMDIKNQKPKEAIMIPASFAATEGNIGSSVNETPPVTTPKAITAELTPEQRRKARIEQARLLLADATKRLSHAPAEVSYRGVSEDDTTKTVDNMRKNQSSAFVLRRF